MRALRVGTILVVMTAAPAFGSDVRVGLIGGASVLERTDTSLTHGPLQDEITVGRSWLAGASVDVRFTEHDSLGFEFVYGPYHNDIERDCITSTGSCDLAPFRSVSRAVVYGMQYAHAFGRSAWRPFAGAGFGIRRWSYQEPWASGVSRPTISLAAGTESSARTPVRLELRAQILQQTPFLLEKTQLELQARITVLLSQKK